LPNFDPSQINFFSQFFWRKGQSIDNRAFEDGSIEGSKIVDNSLSVTKLDVDIATQAELDAGIGGVNAVISGVSGDVTTIEGQVADHETRITQNESDIATNAADIATNAADIAELQLPPDDMFFSVWAEENNLNNSPSTSVNGGNQWSFGNGDETPSADGIVLAYPAKLIGMSLNVEAAGFTSSVYVQKNGVDITGASIDLTVANGNAKYIKFPTPFDFAAGDVVNFHTTATGNGDSARVTAFFKAKRYDLQISDTAPMLFVVWAEEAGAGLSATQNGGYQWSFGNGDDTPQAEGIVLAFPAKLIAVSLNVEGPTATGELVVVRNGVDLTGSEITISPADGNNKYVQYTTTFAFNAGDILNFHTTATANGASTRVAAYLVTDMADL
jgi:hypothetical protein